MASTANVCRFLNSSVASTHCKALVSDDSISMNLPERLSAQLHFPVPQELINEVMALPPEMMNTYMDRMVVGPMDITDDEYRMFHAANPNLLPTMFIMIAPPAVGFISYLNLVPDLDNFARVLYYSALFLTLLLLVPASRASERGPQEQWAGLRTAASCLSWEDWKREGYSC